MTDRKAGRPDCPKCKGEGTVKDQHGTISICFDCLRAGQFEQHGKPKDSGLQI
jgi:hypothetical protein